jgi:hypothetical protein
MVHKRATAAGKQQQPQPAPPQGQAEQAREENAEIEQQHRHIVRPQPCDPRRGKAADQPHQRGWRTVAERERESENTVVAISSAKAMGTPIRP